MFEALSVPSFMPDGGTLGYYLRHAYPHTHKKLMKTLPSALKGADMVLYESCQALQLRTQLVPYMNDFDGDDMDEYQRESMTDAMSDIDDDGEEIEREPTPVEGFTKAQLVPFSSQDGARVEQSELAMLFNWGDPVKKGDITWVTAPKHEELQAAFMHVCPALFFFFPLIRSARSLHCNVADDYLSLIHI